MAPFACDHCSRDFEADEARCPQCLRKSTVRERSPVSSATGTPLVVVDPGSRPGLYLGLLSVSLLLSAGLPVLVFSLAHTLDMLRGHVSAVCGLLVFAFVSMGTAPRLAVASYHPLLVYLAWQAMAAVLGTTAMAFGIFATWMLADTSVVLAALVGAVLWLAVAIPTFNYGRGAVIAPDKVPATRSSGKWR